MNNLTSNLSTGPANLTINLFKQYGLIVLIIVICLIIWSLIWKGIALWKSARNHHKVWFIIFLIINTLGILEIIYIFLIARKSKNKEEAPTLTQNN